MDEFVSKVTLEVNGQKYEDFIEVTEDEVVSRKEVPLANKVGVCDVLEVHKVTLKVPIPKGKAEYDWKGVKNGTLTIDHEDGTRKSYKGVSYLSKGAVTKGKDDAAEQEIRFLAEGLQ